MLLALRFFLWKTSHTVLHLMPKHTMYTDSASKEQNVFLLVNVWDQPIRVFILLTNVGRAFSNTTMCGQPTTAIDYDKVCTELLWTSTFGNYFIASITCHETESHDKCSEEQHLLIYHSLLRPEDYWFRAEGELSKVFLLLPRLVQ